MTPSGSDEWPDDLKDKVGDLFQKLTKYDRHAMRRRGMIWPVRPALYKSYPDAKRVSLPAPAVEGGPGLWEVAARRRSHRTFAAAPLSLQALSQLLWATQGITRRQTGYAFRAAPSAGALYPVETYVVAHRVETIEPGVYHYDVRSHALELINQGDHGDDVARAALDQPMAAQAAAVFVWTAVVDRSKWKYRQRAYRYVYLDAGHIGHALALAAEALSLGSCAIGALYDEEVNAIVGVDGKGETAVYMAVVGHRE